jgi:hypothetical protein
MAGAREGLEELDAELAEDEDAVLVHLGVYGGETRMRLEYRAFNVADFRCPDQCSEMPKNEPVKGAGKSCRSGAKCRRSVECRGELSGNVEQSLHHERAVVRDESRAH